MGFTRDFLWGAASASFQVEGAWAEDGKAPGICDMLFEGHTAHGDNGRVSSDHYHHMKEDVDLMKKLGLKSYRFSVSWPRVIPRPGMVNKKGLDFYVSLVDELRKAGIEPMCTLFHWDMPMWMHEKGGWVNPKIADYFCDYVKTVVEALSDKVSWWFTFNEPQCFAGGGYADAFLPPFYKEPLSMVKCVTRNVMLSHGRAVQLIRKYAKTPAKIGFAPTGPVFTPIKDDPLRSRGSRFGDEIDQNIRPVISGYDASYFTEEQIEEARKLTYDAGMMKAGSNSWWADPIVLGKIPEILSDTLTEQDIKIIHQPLDFYAFNVYTSLNAQVDSSPEFPRYIYPGMPRTGNGWAYTPEVMYWAVRFHYERYHLPILISENGMANNDMIMEDGHIHDPQRIEYLHQYLKCLKKAVEEGFPVIGYQYWSIMDNMEWSSGFDPRFGLIYVDYLTGKRTVKDSAMDYSEIIRTNGEYL